MKNHAPRFLALVEEVRARIAEIPIEEMLRRRETGEAFLLIDVREESEWEEGRIPGSIHLGRGILERDIETVVPDPDTPMVLYCGGGYRSALAADALGRMGYRQVISLEGGIRGWRDRGLPESHDRA